MQASADAALNSVLQALAVKDGAVEDHSGDVAELAVPLGAASG